jgi:hypothetical protein
MFTYVYQPQKYTTMYTSNQTWSYKSTIQRRYQADLVIIKAVPGKYGSGRDKYAAYFLERDTDTDMYKLIHKHDAIMLTNNSTGEVFPKICDEPSTKFAIDEITSIIAEAMQVPVIPRSTE